MMLLAMQCTSPLLFHIPLLAMLLAVLLEMLLLAYCYERCVG